MEAGGGGGGGTVHGGENGVGGGGAVLIRNGDRGVVGSLISLENSNALLCSQPNPNNHTVIETTTPNPPVNNLGFNNTIFNIGSSDSINRPPSVTSISNCSVISNGIGNGVDFRGNGSISPGARSVSSVSRGNGSISPGARSVNSISRGNGSISPDARSYSSGATSPAAAAESHTKDKRAEKLAVGGLVLSCLALLLSLTAVSTSQWARFAGEYFALLLSFLDTYSSISYSYLISYILWIWENVCIMFVS